MLAFKFFLTEVFLITISHLGIGSANNKAFFCLPTYDGEKICSPEEVPDGEVYTNLLQSVMSIAVDRKGLLEITPEKFDEPAPAALGPLTPNSKLDENSTEIFKFLDGPESMFKVDNTLYAAADNAIYQVDLKTKDYKIIFNGNADCPNGNTCSRPLGTRVKGNRLLCADARLGLIEVNIETGVSKNLLSVGTPVDGIALTFPDDLDVDWEHEIVYMSDASSKWGFENWMPLFLESDSSSRIIRFNLKTGKADVFAENIRFANGVQISLDKKFLLVDEFSARRILKFPLNDPVPVKGSPFTVSLPGHPDNIRPSLAGGYWVALPFAQKNGRRSLIDELHARPELTKKLGNTLLTVGSIAENFGNLLKNPELQTLGAQVRSNSLLKHSESPFAMILELDADGKILQSLQSQQTGYITEVLETQDGLLLGSFSNHFLLEVPRKIYRED